MRGQRGAGGGSNSKTVVRAGAILLFVGAVVWMAMAVARPTHKEEAPLEFTVHEEHAASPAPSPRASAAAHMMQQQRPSPQPSVVVRSPSGPAQQPHAEGEEQEEEEEEQRQQQHEDATSPPTPAPQFDLGRGQASYAAWVDSLRASAVRGQWRRVDEEARNFEISDEEYSMLMDVFEDSEGFKPLAEQVAVQCMHLRDVLALDVDQNGDYDILTVNHNAEQTLLMNNGGGFSEPSPARADLTIAPALPGLAVHPEEPIIDDNGLYIYWTGDRLHFFLYIQPGRIGRESSLPDPVEVSVTVPLGPVSIFAGESSSLTDVTVRDIAVGDVTVSEALIRLHHGARFALSWRRKALEVDIVVDADRHALPLDSIHVGHSLTSPPGFAFTVALQDRHTYVTLDANGDGWQDLLILRGGLQGDITALKYSDELLEFDPAVPEYRNAIHHTGLAAKAARSNQAAVGDFDGDGTKELLVSSRDCRAAPDMPRMLDLGRTGEGSRPSFSDVSNDFFPAFFGSPSILSFTQFVVADMNRDGIDDIVSIGPFGVYFHTYVGDSLFHEPCSDMPVFGSIDMCNAALSTAVDINGDGYPEIIVASSSSIVLTYSPSAERIVAFPTADLGLPADIHLARWVDYDNDGCVDLFTVPGGLYHSFDCDGSDGKGFFGAFFERTGTLEVGIPLPRSDFESSWVQWIDVDGDGSLDLAPFVLKTRSSSSTCDAAMIALNYRSSGNWLQVDVDGPAGAPFCHSAEVTVVDSSGRAKSARVGSAEHSRYSQTHTRLYFGLGRFDVASVYVKFPGGAVVSAANVCTNCRISVGHPSI